MEKGHKGVGSQVWTGEEFCEFFKITREDLDAWIGQGLKAKRVLDASLRITETAVDDFFRGRVIESPYLSTDEAAAYCNVSKDAFYGRVERRKIKPLPGSGKENRFTREQCDNDEGRRPMNKERHTVELADGQRVKFVVAPARASLLLRVLSGPGRAAAGAVHEGGEPEAGGGSRRPDLKEEYSPRPAGEGRRDEATAAMVRAMKANNLRDRTIGDYKLMLADLAKCTRRAGGPADHSRSRQDVQARRMEAGLTACTVAGNINKLSVIWSKWSIERSANSWPPTRGRTWSSRRWTSRNPGYIEPEEQQAFFDWLEKRWNGWRLPVLLWSRGWWAGGHSCNWLPCLPPA